MVPDMSGRPSKFKEAFQCLLQPSTRVISTEFQFNPRKALLFVRPGFVAILGLQPRDKAAMLVVNTKEIFLLNLHQNRVHFPAERNAFVLDPQHDRRDVTCKPATIFLVSEMSMFALAGNDLLY